MFVIAWIYLWFPGEFGGLGLPVENHTWQKKITGDTRVLNAGELLKRYSELIDHIPDLISKGLSAAVYTQTTDVEVETSGLMTYDHKEIKIPTEKLKAMHNKLYNRSLVTVAAK